MFFDFLARLFRNEPSGAKAKERLRLVLLSDHLALAPDVVESLKTDLLEVLSRYVEVDIEHVDVTFEQREHEVAMLANVPILSMKQPHERQRPVAVAESAPAAAVPALAVEPPVAMAEQPAVADGGSVAPPEVQAEAGETAEATPRAEVIPLPVAPSAPGLSKPSRSKRRKRRKAGMNGVTAAQQSTTGVGTPTQI